MLQITILGCGASLGVPIIGCNCSVCKSPSPYNKRTRSSIIIESLGTKVLVDFGFDIKSQLIRAGITNINAAILTHDHADHVSGIDDLRVFSFIHAKPFEIFTDLKTSNIIEERYEYLFKNKNLLSKPVGFFDKFNIENLEIQLFRQIHSSIGSIGIRVGNFVYSSDVSDFPEESEKFLQNIEVWILDCLSYKSNDCHAGLDKVLEWNNKYTPKQIYLTNMRHDVDYHEMSKILPQNIEPLYDGYQITC